MTGGNGSNVAGKVTLLALLVGGVGGLALWGLSRGEPAAEQDLRPGDGANRPTLPAEGITILDEEPRSADPRYEATSGNPSALISVTEKDGRRGLLLFGLGDPDHAGRLQRNLVLALADRRLDPARARAAVVFSHFHFNIFPPVASGPSPPLRDFFPGAIRDHPRLAVQGPNLAQLCKLNRPSGHLMGSCQRRPRSAPVGLAPLQWSDGSSGRIRLLTYAFAPPMEQERSSGISLTPQETVLVISAPPGYLVFSFCSHMQATSGPRPPARHAAYLVKQAITTGKLAPGPIHTLVTGSCDFQRTLERQRLPGGAGPATARKLVAKMRAELGIRRLFLVHCGLSGDPSVFGAELAYPGAVIPLE